MSTRESSVRFGKAEALVVVYLSAILLLTVYRSGTMTDYGLSFWGPNGHDAVFHLALVSSISKGEIWSNPLIAGEGLKNYHLGYDLLVAGVGFLTGVNTVDLFFRVMPALTVVSLMLGAYWMMTVWGFGRLSRLLGLHMLALAGSLGFLKTIWVGDWFGGESVFWANQSASILLNPPYALSLALMFWWLWLITIRPKHPVLLWMIYIAPAIAFHVKAYAGVLMIAALVVDGLWGLVVGKSGYRRVVLRVVVALLVFVLSALTAVQGESLVVFLPMWFVKELVGSPDRWQISRLALAYDNWFYGGQLLKLSILQIILLVVFWVGNMGVRVFGLYLLARHRENRAKRVALLIVVMGMMVPVFFVQRGTPWNTIQFFYYSMALCAIFCGEFFWRKMYRSNTILGFLGWVLVLCAGTLTTWGTLRDYLSPTPASYVSYDEMAVLAKVDKGIILTRPYEAVDKRQFYAPLPLYVYESTAYVAMLTGEQCYLCNEVNLSIMGYDQARKINLAKEVYGGVDSRKIKTLLEQTSSEYVYVDPVFPLKFDLGDLSYRMVAEAGGFRLWQRQ